MDCDLIDRICRRVFPPGSEVTWDADEVAPEERFWVIPGKQGSRWIFPADPTHGWPCLKQWRPNKLSSRAKWQILLAVYRRGQLGRLPGIKPLGIAGHREQTWDHFGWSGRKSPIPVIYIGTPGPARKAVVALIDSDAYGVASIGKIPLGPEASRAICREAEILTRLEKEKPDLAPRLLFVDKQTGVAVQEFFQGEPTGRRLTEAHLSWLLNLEIPGETISLREKAEGLARQIAGLKNLDQGTRNTLNRVLSDIDDPSALRATWVHGDFALWNLKRTPSQTLRAIDWESASPSGLPLFDLIYYRSIQTIFFGERSLFPKRLRPLLHRYGEHMGIDPSMLPKLTLACLAQHCLWCHEQGDLQRASFLLRQLSVMRTDMA